MLLRAQLLIMETKTVVIKSIFVNDDNCTLYFTESIKGITKNGDTFEDGQTDHLSFSNKQLNAAIRNIIEEAECLFQVNGNKSLSGKQIAAVLSRAIVTLDRTTHQEGEEYVDDDGVVGTYSHNGYNKQILDIKLSRMAMAALQQIAIQAMLG